jgi:ribosomal protein S12 methylthiotransferase accessory factor
MKKINKHWFGESKKLINLSEIKDKSRRSFKDNIDTSINLITKKGFNKILYVDLTRFEIQIPVVRVLIPGLEVYSVDRDRMGKRLI